MIESRTDTGDGAPHDLPSELERLEPGVVHVNAAVGGTAPDAYDAVERVWSRRVHPDLGVVYLFTGNDLMLDDPVSFCGDGPLLDYATPTPTWRCPTPHLVSWRSPRFVFAHSPPPFPLRMLATHSHLAGWLMSALLHLRGALAKGVQPMPSEQHVERALAAMRDDLKAQHAPLVVVLIPLRSSLVARDPTSTYGWQAREEMLAIARRLGLPVIDTWDFVAAGVKQDGDSAWFRDLPPGDVHFRAQGDRRLATYVNQQLSPFLVPRLAAH